MTQPWTNTTKPSLVVTGLFDDRESAESAYQSLVDLGYDQNDIGIVLSDDARARLVSAPHPSGDAAAKAFEGAGVGGAIGGAMGAILGAVALGTAIAIPGLGLAIAGPLVAALAGAGAGGISGGLVGALVGLGMSEESAQDYEEGVRTGKILLSVSAHDEGDAERIQESWERVGAEAVRG
jgi:hypothetical protein